MHIKDLWKKKVEVNEEVTKLTLLSKSEPYQLWTKKIREAMKNDLIRIIASDYRDKQGIVDLACQFKSKYDTLMIVPNEQMNWELLLEDVEKDEARQVEQSREQAQRLRPRESVGL